MDSGIYPALERKMLDIRQPTYKLTNDIMTDNPFSENPAFTAGSKPSPSDAANDLRGAASDFAKSTSDQAHKVKDRAVEAASAFKASATQKAEELKEAASDKAEHYKAVASEKAHQAKATAQAQWDDTRVKAKEIHVTAEDYIRQNPTKAILGALGVGFLIGLIARN